MAEETEYTHTFEFLFNDQTLQGEIEFNLDGKTSYKTEKPISNLDLKQSSAVNTLFYHLKEIYNVFGDIKKIKVEKKQTQ
jgi:hypothetical protein